MASPKIAVSQLFLCALLGFTGIDGKPPSALLGGDTALDNEFPYQVSLRTFRQHTCGGSIIDSTHILTAAHCVYDVRGSVDFMTVIAGTNYVRVGKGKRYRIKKVTLHPEFSDSESDSWRNDIAIITLTSEIEFNRRHRPVKLPTTYRPKRGKVTACGWGDVSYPDGTTPVDLRKLSMTVVPNSRCALAGLGKIHDTQMCAYSSVDSGICTGDSGGPLLEDETVVGIASYVIPCGLGYPDVFTRVYSYIDWIKEVTEKS